MKNKWVGHLLAVVTISIWSSTFIVSKIILENLSPLQVLLTRFMLAVICLFVIYPKFKRPTSIKEELKFMLIAAALVGYFIFENSALQRTYTSNVSLIVATIPLMTGLVAWLTRGEKFFTRSRIIGFIIAYVGVSLIVLNGTKLEGISPVGDGMAFGAAIMFAIYSLVMEMIKGEYHLIQLTRKVFLYGLMYLAAIVWLTGEDYSLSLITGEPLPGLLYLGIVAASFAFIMWNKAITVIGPIKTNQYIYLVPVITTIFSSLILREKITWMTVAGTIAILFGLYLSDREAISSEKMAVATEPLD